jgi:hypothetical protein
VQYPLEHTFILLSRTLTLPFYLRSPLVSSQQTNPTPHPPSTRFWALFFCPFPTKFDFTTSIYREESTVWNTGSGGGKWKICRSKSKDEICAAKIGRNEKKQVQLQIIIFRTWRIASILIPICVLLYIYYVTYIFWSANWNGMRFKGSWMKREFYHSIVRVEIFEHISELCSIKGTLSWVSTLRLHE